MGEETLRSHAKKIVHAALNAVAPERCLLQAVRLACDCLVAADQKIDLSLIKRIIVVGIGKGAPRMAAALEQLLGDRIDTGVIVTTDGYRVPTQRVKVIEAGHPIPDKRAIAAGKRIADLVDKADKDDLVIALISGGGSALLTLPSPGISLADLVRTNDLLLRAGARIDEFNTVRKHLSQLKGGQLAKRAFPARVLTLILSDIPGDPVSVIASGPSVPDPTTFADVAAVLQRYRLWKEIPSSVREHIEKGVSGEVAETPKPGDSRLASMTTAIIGSGVIAAEAACDEGKRLGYHTLLLTTTLAGEAKEVGGVFAALAREEVQHRRPLPLPVLIIASGETTVTVNGPGKGGRNQELALAASAGIAGLPGVVCVAMGTDGRDGPTDAAGGITDGGTVSRLHAHGISLEDSLAQNDSYSALSSCGDLLITGPTGTNVADLYFLLVGRRESGLLPQQKAG